MSDIDQSPESEDADVTPAAAEQAEIEADAVLADTTVDPTDAPVPPTDDAVDQTVAAVGEESPVEEVAAEEAAACRDAPVMITPANLESSRSASRTVARPPIEWP